MSRAKYNLSNDTDVPSCFPASECRYAAPSYGEPPSRRQPVIVSPGRLFSPRAGDDNDGVIGFY